MANRLRKRARRMLEARFDELEELYLRHREAAEWLVHESERFTPISLAHFAAGQAALEASWRDAVISLDDHIWLLQGHTVIVSQSVDDFSECEAGFEVEISPPLTMSTASDAVQAYLTAAGAVRSEIRSQSATLALFYELAKFEHVSWISPYRLTATGTLLWAKLRRGLDRQTVRQVDARFEIMHILVEQIDLALPEIADWLEQELERTAGDRDPRPTPEDEWKDW